MIDYMNIVAMISAMCTAYRTGKDILQSYQKFLDSPDIKKQAAALQKAFSTYSQKQVDAIVERIENCREKFIKEGSGKQHIICMCSVLNDVKVGNGGTLPDIDQWQETHEQLCH